MLGEGWNYAEPFFLWSSLNRHVTHIEGYSLIVWWLSLNVFIFRKIWCSRSKSRCWLRREILSKTLLESSMNVFLIMRKRAKSCSSWSSWCLNTRSRSELLRSVSNLSPFCPSLTVQPLSKRFQFSIILIVCFYLFIYKSWKIKYMPIRF